MADFLFLTRLSYWNEVIALNSMLVKGQRAVVDGAFNGTLASHLYAGCILTHAYICKL